MSNNDNFAIAGFVLSIVGLFVSGWVGTVVWIVALVFCILGLKSSRHHGLAVAGLVLEFLGLVLLALMMAGCTALVGLGTLAVL